MEARPTDSRCNASSTEEEKPRNVARTQLFLLAQASMAMQSVGKQQSIAVSIVPHSRDV